MALNPEQLSRLAAELAALTPEERRQVLAQAARHRFRPLPKNWKPPVLAGGDEWIGGSLRREEMYDDDGR
jgi:hypothetical protein